MAKVSVVMPVYNAECYLKDTLGSLLAQSFADIEIICVDDGSTDSSLSILEKEAHLDRRIKIIKQNNAGAGAARNAGLRQANGTYTLFFDADDDCSPCLIDKAVRLADRSDADIVAWNFDKFDDSGWLGHAVGVHTDLLPATIGSQAIPCFSWRDCPDVILSVVNPTPWNKLYKTSFLNRNAIFFDELYSTNDIAFCAESVARAERITYTPEHLVKYRVHQKNSITASKKTKYVNVIKAVSSTFCRLAKCDYYNEIEKSVLYFAIDNYVSAMRYFERDYSSAEFKDYYEFLHEEFNKSCYAALELADFIYELNFVKFLNIKKNTYVDFLDLANDRKLIISLTSIPERIDALRQGVDSLLHQTVRPDKIAIYLAESQFSSKDADLPKWLRQYKAKGLVEVNWVNEDLKAHKKYLYSFERFPDDLIITVDDDLIYCSDMIEYLFECHLLYPRAISTMRAHVIPVDNGKVLEYAFWPKEIDLYRYRPSMQLLSTNGAGSLFAPRFFVEGLLDPDVITKLCLNADDLWIKAMQVASALPVVVARPNPGLVYIDGSQEVALYHTNIVENDVQMTKIVAWFDDEYHVDEPKFVSALAASSGRYDEEITFGVKELAESFLYDKKREVDNQAEAFLEKIGQLEQSNREKQAEIERINSSHSMKIGRVLMFLPGKMKALLKKIKRG